MLFWKEIRISYRYC